MVGNDVGFAVLYESASDRAELVAFRVGNDVPLGSTEFAGRCF